MRWILFLWLSLSASLVWSQITDREVSQAVRDQVPYAVRLGQWLHRYPELSGQERKTAQRMAQEVRRLDMQVLEKVGGHGLVALHDAGHLPAGDIAVSPGYVTANVDSVDIVVYGRGGHGAKPQTAIDPILIAANIVVALQSIVSRRIRPGEPAVITVGQFQAGSKHNIIPDTAQLMLTVRSYGDEMRDFLHQEIRRVVQHVALAYHAPKKPSVTFRDEYTPSGSNDRFWTDKLKQKWIQVFSNEQVKDALPVTVGEDFSQYSRQRKIPSVLFWLGATQPDVFAKRDKEDIPDLHSARFVVDFPGALRTGMQAMVHAVLLGLEYQPG